MTARLSSPLVRLALVGSALGAALPLVGCPRPGPDGELPQRGPRVLDGSIVARCLATGPWRTGYVTHHGAGPFSVLVGAPGRWSWVGTSSGGPLAVPLGKLTAAGAVDVFVVAGAATVRDRVAAKDDGALNRQIARQQQRTAAVSLSTATTARGAPIVNECLHPNRNHDGCTSPQCPHPPQ
ncbi:MAG: hypothetical protein R3B48_23415 [Kofleriaceae bacterium]